MKQAILFLFCCFLFNSQVCYSQIESKTKSVCGYSNTLNEVTMGITFGKISNPVDTTYYIRFRVAIPAKQYKKIYISSQSSLTFLTRSGKNIDLKIAGVKSTIESDHQIKEKHIGFTQDDFSTVLTIPVTRKQLAEIGSEPFYKIKLPYFEKPSKKDELIFPKPALLVDRDFTQIGARYVLGI